MTIIPIDDRFQIVADSEQWIVQQSYQSNGETKWKNKTYHKHITGAISDVYQRGLRCSEAVGFLELMKVAENWLQTLRDRFPLDIQVVRKV